MINQAVIEAGIKEKYETELINLFALANSNQVPAICLTGNDKSLLSFVMHLFLSSYENKKYHEIYNSNDFYEIESNTQPIKIDDIRKLIKFSTLKKEHLKHKYTVIKNIENANTYAQNSLLKVIEEPGIDTLFLCSSCAFSTLLNTIRSRLFSVSIPNKALNNLDSFFCDEIRWLANLSFDVLNDFSQLSKSEQKQMISSIRKKHLNEIIEDFIRSCGEYELEIGNGIILQSKSLKRLFAVMFVEKMIIDILYHSSEEVQELVFQFKALINKKSLYKGTDEKITTSAFNNLFFKDLFSVTEKVIYIMLNFQEGALLGTMSYTKLTELCLKSKFALKKKKTQHLFRFLEVIKNTNQISLNSELIMINYINLLRKIFLRK